MNIKESVFQFLDEVGGTKSYNTQRSYQNGLNVFLDYLEAIEVKTTSPLEILEINHFIGCPGYMGKRRYSKKTIALYTSSIRVFFNWLVVNGHFDPTPQEALRFQMAYKDVNKRREKRLPRWPQKNDVDKMLEAVREMEEDEIRKSRNIAIIEFLASTGCRNSEICELKVKDLNMKELSTVVTGKGDKERVVFFNNSAKDALIDYWKVRKNAGPESFVFSRHDRGAGKKIKGITTAGVRYIVKSVAKVAGIKNFTPHYFRHAFAIKVLRETGNLALTQDLMGHADPSATRVYAKIYPEDLREMHHEIFN